MSRIQLSDLDLRLLRVLDALLDTNSVSRAAAELGVTPSAVSHSLRDLRLRIGDPLFVRSGSAFEPTPRAQSLRPVLRRALVELEGLLNDDAAFDPVTSNRQFSLATPDFLAARFSNLAGSFEREAPNAAMKLFAIDSRVAERLASGELDLVLTAGYAEQFLALDRQTFRVKAWSDRFVCVARNGHPLLANGVPNLEGYCQTRHMFISVSGVTRGIVDDLLQMLGRERQVRLLLSTASAVVGFVRKTDLIATVPESLVMDAVAAGEIASFPPPFELPVANAHLWWHARLQHDHAHAWWRNMVLRSLA